jgi:hypothetical protein
MTYVCVGPLGDQSSCKVLYFLLTKAGRKQLQTETKRWERISLAMGTALGIN